MTAADIVRWLPTLIGLLSGPAGAGIIVSWWKHRERTRAQTDTVALDLVGQLRERLDQVEEASSQERKLCDARLEALRHELKNVQGQFDALLLAIEFAPEKAAEIVARVKSRRRPEPMDEAA